jgi:ABC-type sugar transport system ATPase subunit
MRNADILVLDEPSAALDAASEHKLFERFQKLADGKMAILISHRFSTVRMADRIAVLAGGTIEELGTHDELLKANGRYAELYGLQLRTLVPGHIPNVNIVDAEMTVDLLGARRAPIPLPPFVRASLEIVGGPSASGHVHTLTMTETLIGRTESDVVLDDPGVSRRHASISYVDQRFRVRDERSANGTYLNGSRVGEYDLEDGDEIRVGETILNFRATTPLDRAGSASFRSVESVDGDPVQ